MSVLDECLGTLREAGIKPVLLHLDNEISNNMIRRIRNKEMTYQLASPGDYRLLPAERAIQTIRNYLVAILHGANPDFPAN